MGRKTFREADNLISRTHNLSSQSMEKIRQKEEENEGWKRMTNYELKRDEILDKETEENLVKYPLGTMFKPNVLRRIGVLESYDTKTENDYSGTRFPSSSQVIDFVRGSLTFKTCKDCVEALEKLEEAAKDKKTCISEIGRVKNLFLKKFSGGGPIDSYADIKANILVEFEGKSMVCELQFLLETMIKAKRKNHEIYEIKRTTKFRENVVKVRDLYPTPEEEILAIAVRQNEKELGRFMLNHPYPYFDYFAKSNENGSSLIHYLAQSGSVKLMKLFLAGVSTKHASKFDVLNVRGEKNRTPLSFDVSKGHFEMVKVSTIPTFLRPLAHNSKLNT